MIRLASSDTRTPPTVPAGPFTGARTVGGIALAAAARHHGPALTRPGAAPVSFAELGVAAREIAAGLAALGIERGDHVAILAGTRPEWTLADFGAMCAGATVVPIYHTSSAEECRYILAHAEVRALFCEDRDQLAKVERVRDACPRLEHMILIEGEAAGAVSLADLRARAGKDADVLVAERLSGVAPQDVATIVYTSGTTGPPKGCVVTHASLLATAAMYEQQLDLPRVPELVVYLFLPLAHSLARVAQIAIVDAGGTLAFWGGDPARIVDELSEIRPTHLPSVPRIYEKAHGAVLTGVSEQRRLKRAIFRLALRQGAARRAAERRGERVGRLAQVGHRLADRLVLSRVRAVFGDRLIVALCGAAPVSRDVLEFFDACGVLVLEGYGMTETCAAATLNTPSRLRFGSVGAPLPGTEIAIAADGEVLIAGPSVFAGYHRDPEATGEVMDGRWLRTGDLGALDDDGFLSITGRKKDLIITSSGKNISPENLESALRETPWIANAVVAGDRRSYLVALVTLDTDEAPRLAAELGIPADPAAMAHDERVRATLQRDIDEVNARFARIEQIKRFDVLERDLSQAEGELTPTLKVKRPVIYARFADRFERLYEA
ncbi:MAG TPA: long-chain fatty acid--CoA ligase [Solirubrobacteraceae bacterium]|nr:long-chain fatty acid--CoA ligase [Solirubrobacteraceae bacterium]